MSFQGELMHLINRHNLEERYDIPDAVLAKYLCDCHSVLGESLVRLRLHEARKTSGESGAVDNRHTTGKGTPCSHMLADSTYPGVPPVNKNVTRGSE